MTAYYQARVGHQWMASVRQVQPTLNVYAAALASSVREAFATSAIRSWPADTFAIHRTLAPAYPRAVRCAFRYGKLTELPSRPLLSGSEQIRADIAVSRKPGIAISASAIGCKSQKKRNAAAVVNVQLLNSIDKI